jgi:hypothetical protein
LAKNSIWRLLLVTSSLRMRRNGYNSTSDLNSGIAIGSGMPENLYVSKISSKKHKLAPFCEFVTNLPYSPHCEKNCACASNRKLFPDMHHNQ